MNNYLGATAAEVKGPSEAATPTTSAVVPPLGSSTYNLNAYHNQSLTAQWMTTGPGALTVMSSALYWLQGQPVPFLTSSRPVLLPVISLTLPSGAYSSFGAHTCLGRVPSGTLVLAWGVQGRQEQLPT